MSFIHAYLLGGLLLAGVPVLLHLILRQKPKRLTFPAFRFLKARQKINTRRMQLQHLLLLLVRILIISALCLALARPRLFSNRLLSSTDRPVVAALLFDTSSSMEYTVGGVSRLEDAKKRCRELLDEMDAGSRVAVLDSGDDTQAVLLPPSESRSRVEALRIRPAAGSLNGAVERALRLLEQQGQGEDGPPRLLYVFSDRTRACWDPAGVKPQLPEGATVLWVDVGVEAPRDLGIDKVEVIPQVVAPGGSYQVRVTVRGTPGGHENELHLSIDSDLDGNGGPDRRPVQLDKGVTGDTIVFDRTAPQLPAGTSVDVPFQLTVRLGTRDALPVNNSRHATFFVRGSRKLLTLVEKKDPVKTRIWEAIHASTHSFACEVRTLAEADKLTQQELAGYSVIALFEVPAVPAAWWQKLARHVGGGGGLVIVPGGEEVVAGLEDFNKEGLAARVLPAALTELVRLPVPQKVYWERFSGAHPLMAPFVAWVRGVDPDFAREELRPFARCYWKLGPLAKGSIAVTGYADRDKSPALAERSEGKGRVILFTTPLDFRYVDAQRTMLWNNYWPPSSSFGLVLTDRVCRYLAGEVSLPELNFTCGETASVRLSSAPEPPLLVNGPGLAGAERNLKLPGEDGTLPVPQAVVPGNYLVVDGKNQAVAGFSLNVAARESDLERVAVEELEAVLGTGILVRVDQAMSLSDALNATRPPPVELLPLLMLILLLVLSFESLLANRFYRSRAPAREVP